MIILVEGGLCEPEKALPRAGVAEKNLIKALENQRCRILAPSAVLKGKAESYKIRLQNLVTSLHLSFRLLTRPPKPLSISVSLRECGP